MAGKFALIVGNSHYDDPSLSRLKAPDVDVQALEEVLKNPEIGSFTEVTSLLNETCAVVRKAVARFFENRRRDDLLLIYFSGHGVKDEQGHLYLALRDTETALLAGSAIESEFISGRMDRSFSKRQVLVLDCCHSGAFAYGAKAGQGVSVGTGQAFEGQGVGRVVLTATDATQYAWEGDQVIGDAHSSLFTHFLIEGLRTGAADRDNDGVVTVDELYDYVHENVINTTPKQTPYKWTYRQHGEIVLAQNPFAHAFALPPEVKEAKGSSLSSLRFEAVQALATLLRGHHAGRARAALAALKELAHDDSRKVATAAAEALRAYEVGEPAPPVETAADPIDGATADIFISYAREDRAKASALAEVLVARGWRVWWDRKIAPGEAFDVTIERALSTCKCAVVLWSAKSVNATWVRNEARRAKKRHVLVPVLIEQVETPLEFENLQAADLTTWDLAANHPELQAVLDRIQDLSPIPLDAERVVTERAEAARRDAERVAKERAEAGRREAERREKDRAAEAARVQAERVERERAHAARLEAERLDLERARSAVDAARIARETADDDVAVERPPPRSFWVTSRLVQISLAIAVLALIGTASIVRIWPSRAPRTPQVDSRAAAPTTGTAAPITPATTDNRSQTPPPLTGTRLPPSAGPQAPVVPQRTPPETTASKSAALRLDELRARARGLIQTGDRAQALDAVMDGLQISSGDPALRTILEGMLRDAESKVAHAKPNLLDVAASDRGKAAFVRGQQAEQTAIARRRAGKVDVAIRLYWAAAEQFTAAAALAEEDAAQVRSGDQRRRASEAVTPPRPAPSAPAERKPLNPDTEQDIVRETLRRYEAAYASLKAENVAALFPAAPLDQLAREFAGYLSYNLIVKVTGTRFFTQGDGSPIAVSSAVVTHDIQPKSGARNQFERPQTFHLEKRGSAWVIVDVR